MEDAQIQAGNGLIKRGEELAVGEATSTHDYFAKRRMKTPGTKEYQELQEMKKRQSGLRKIIESKVTQLIEDDMRYR